MSSIWSVVFLKPEPCVLFGTLVLFSTEEYIRLLCPHFWLHFLVLLLRFKLYWYVCSLQFSSIFNFMIQQLSLLSLFLFHGFCTHSKQSVVKLVNFLTPDSWNFLTCSRLQVVEFRPPKIHTKISEQFFSTRNQLYGVATLTDFVLKTA